MKSLRIHYSAPAWHGGYQRFFSNALRSLGHDVLYFDDNGTEIQKLLRKIFVRVPRLQYYTDDLYRETVSRRWLASVRAYKPDLIILEHTPNVLPQYIRLAKKDGVKIYYWMDAGPAGPQAKDAIAGAMEADKVFSVDRAWMTILYAPDDFTHLPVAGDPKTFYPIHGMKKEYDVVYLGSIPPESGDGYLRAKILASLPSKYRIAVFGNGADYWIKYFPILRNRIKVNVLLPAEKLNEIYNKAEIVLNIHSNQNLTSLSGRTYEIALSGAFQLVDWREDIDLQFSPGSFVTFKYAKEINGLVETWLKKPDERAKIAANARAQVLAEGTWQHRAEEMLKSF